MFEIRKENNFSSVTLIEQKKINKYAKTTTTKTSAELELVYD